MAEETKVDKKACFLGCWEDAVADICYYDRKDAEEDDLTDDDITAMINSGEVTLKEILDRVSETFLRNFPDMKKK